MKKIILSILIYLQIISTTTAQTSTFDAGIDGWKVEGDAQNQTATPVFKKVGGNPGGYAFSKDDATGGVWYWLAPPKYTGNKCNAYGKKLSFDLKTNLTDKQFDQKDVIIASPGAILYYDLPKNPDTSWTHYELKLDETDNWYFNSFPGATPTKAQVQQVLNNVVAIKIRGEYRVGDDEGGLDNVNMEGEVVFNLDGDGSTGAKYGDYNADTLCGRTLVQMPICDDDLMINFNGALPKLINLACKTIIITGQTVNLLAQNTANISFINFAPNGISGIGIKNSADTTELKNFIKSMKLEFDASTMPETFDLTFSFPIGNCTLTRTTKYTVIKKNTLGVTKDTVLCDLDGVVNLNKYLPAGIGGIWKPSTGTAGYFNPDIDKPNTYKLLTKAIDQCPADSFKVKIDVVKIPQNFLGDDKELCQDSSLILDVSALNFDKYTWQDQQQTNKYLVNTAGKYTLSVEKSGCKAQDSLQVTEINCKKCNFYAPNAFSPNSDGVNDYFQVYPSCEKFNEYLLIIYDRWGNHVYKTDVVGEGWDGTFRGKLLNEGVYTYYMYANYDQNNKKIEVEKKGDFFLNK